MGKETNEIKYTRNMLTMKMLGQVSVLPLECYPLPAAGERATLATLFDAAGSQSDAMLDAEKACSALTGDEYGQ